MEKSGLLISARNINPAIFTKLSNYRKVGFVFNNFKFIINHRLSSFPFARRALNTKCSISSSIDIINSPNIELSSSNLTIFGEPHHTHGASQFLKIVNIHNIVDRVFLMDLDPATAKLAISLVGPFLSAFGFLFILRIVMSWYPKLPVQKFPYVIAYAPTEPVLGPTRKVIPPLAGVDVTPVVWFGLISFLSEILVGPQGLLVLLSQKV